MLIPFAAGGSTDVTTRALAKAAEPHLGQPVVIVNKPGAAGAVAMGELKRAPADGYTVAVVGAAAATIAPHLRSVPYDPLNEFDLFMNYGLYSVYFAVAADSPYKTMQDLLNDIQARPGQVVIGTTGAGSMGHIAGERLMEAKGIKAEFAPFTGGSQIIPALLGSHLPAAILGGEVAPHVQDGKIRLLVSMTKEQLRGLADVPTLQSVGIPWSVESWIALGVRKGVPPDRLAALSAAFQKASQSEEFIASMDKLATIVSVLDQNATTDMLKRTYQENGQLIQRLGLAATVK